VYVEALGNGILILNTLEVVNDLLEKRATLYSDRPGFVMVGELMGLDNSLPMLQYGPTWRQHRKLTHLTLNQEAVKEYHDVQEDIIALFLNSLVERPQDFISHLRLTAGRIIMSVTYGLPVETSDDLYITDAERTMEMITMATIPGAFVVDLIPQLKHLPSWLPFNHIHRTGIEGRRRIEHMITRPFQHAKREIAQGTARPSFTSNCLGNYQSIGKSTSERDDLICWAAGAMYGAGGETTYATILTFILAMALYPDVQAKAKAEIDGVVGSGCLPSFTNRPDMPYINATIKEAMRWKPALPMSIARRTSQTDFYQGFYIPKGTIVMPNVWAISMDKRSGIPSEKFAPERFLSSHVKQTATDPYLYAFGFGRRICPGKYLGDNNLFLLITGIIATVNLSKQKDADGKEILLDPEFTSGLVSCAEPFKVCVTPHSIRT